MSANSTSTIKSFYDYLKVDKAARKSFAELLNECSKGLEDSKEYLEKVVTFAKKYGFKFSSNELMSFLDHKHSELSEEELEQIVGGISQQQIFRGVNILSFLALPLVSLYSESSSFFSFGGSTTVHAGIGYSTASSPSSTSASPVSVYTFKYIDENNPSNIFYARGHRNQVGELLPRGYEIFPGGIGENPFGGGEVTVRVRQVGEPIRFLPEENDGWITYEGHRFNINANHRHDVGWGGACLWNILFTTLTDPNGQYRLERAQALRLIQNAELATYLPDMTVMPEQLPILMNNLNNGLKILNQGLPRLGYQLAEFFLQENIYFLQQPQGHDHYNGEIIIYLAAFAENHGLAGHYVPEDVIPLGTPGDQGGHPLAWWQNPTDEVRDDAAKNSRTAVPDRPSAVSASQEETTTSDHSYEDYSSDSDDILLEKNIVQFGETPEEKNKRESSEAFQATNNKKQKDKAERRQQAEQEAEQEHHARCYRHTRAIINDVTDVAGLLLDRNWVNTAMQQLENVQQIRKPVITKFDNRQRVKDELNRVYNDIIRRGPIAVLNENNGHIFDIKRNKFLAHDTQNGDVITYYEVYLYREESQSGKNLPGAFGRFIVGMANGRIVCVYFLWHTGYNLDYIRIY